MSAVKTTLSAVSVGSCGSVFCLDRESGSRHERFIDLRFVLSARDEIELT